MLPRVGSYRLVRTLGEGGMGVVYEALDERLGRTVALKMVRPEFASGASHERFLREARAAAAVQHPHACQIYEVGEHDGRPFLVMELLDGEPLSSRLNRGPVPAREAVDLTVAVLDPLHALHRTSSDPLFTTDRPRWSARPSLRPSIAALRERCPAGPPSVTRAPPSSRMSFVAR